MKRAPYKELCKTTQGDEIRLIELLPGYWTAPLQCKLKHAFLQERPRYEAVIWHYSRHKLKSEMKFFLLKAAACP
jgi:hypothetical protein